MALKRATGLAGSLALGALLGDVCLGAGVTALLGDRDAVQDGVELAVAATVQAVAALVLPEPQGIGAEPQKRANASRLRKRLASPAWAMITAVEPGPMPVIVGNRIGVLDEQFVQIVIECADAPGELLDVNGELANAALGGLLGRSVAQPHALGLADGAPAVELAAASASGSTWVQSARVNGVKLHGSAARAGQGGRPARSRRDSRRGASRAWAVPAPWFVGTAGGTS